MNDQSEKGTYLDATLPVTDRVRDLLSRMTLEEKVAQMTAFYFSELQENQVPSDALLREKLAGGVGQITRIAGSSALLPADVAKAGNAIQRFLMTQTRLKIPALVHEECCCGYMGLGGSIFPQMIGLASTWEPDLAERMASEMRRQMLAVGAREGLAPVLDLARDPRWGRTEETFGEDPYLVSRFGVGYIRGLQGADMRSAVLATGKHFVAHSMPEGGLNCAPVQIGPRAMWEAFLLPYQAAFAEADLSIIMNAYNEMDGEPVAASRAVLTDLLRGRLGFDGIVVSDYASIDMLQNFHFVAPDPAAAAAMALHAGIDLELPSRLYFHSPLLEALKKGQTTQAEIDTAVERVLRLKFRLGLFENPYAPDGAAAACIETADQRALAAEIARKSLVLLKNDGLLPLGKPATIAVIGPNADNPRHMVGDYAYPSMFDLVLASPPPNSPFVKGHDAEHQRKNRVKIPTVLEAIRETAGPGVKILHEAGCPVLDADRSGFDAAVKVAKQADVVVLVLGDKSGLRPDCTSGETRDRADLGLPGVQQALAEAVIAAGKPTVAVLVNGRPLSIPWLQEHAPAILEAWMPGEEGGRAIAEALFGKMNPGGKLPVTIVRTAGQLPMTYNQKPSGGRSNWYGDYVESPVSPLYPFGHGLSYTTFAYDKLSVSPAEVQGGGTVEIGLTVTNTGKTAGDEVVQLYVCDEFAGIPRPKKELKGFARVNLKPGETRSVTFHLPVDMLAFYNRDLDLVTESGKILVMVGSSSQDIRLKGEFVIGASGNRSVGQRIFLCPVSVK